MVNPVVVAHLFRRVLRPGRTVGLGLLAATAGIVYGLVALAGETDDPAVAYHEVVAFLTGPTLSIAVLVIAAAVLGEERDAGTFPYLYLRPIRRGVLAASALAAGLAAAVVLAVAGWMVGWVASWLAGAPATAAVAALGAYVAAAVGYAAVFVPLGYLVPRAVLVGLGYVFVWEGIVATLVEGAAQASVWRIAMSVYADLVELPGGAAAVLGPVVPGVWGAAGKVAGVAAVGWAVLWWALRTRDAG